MRDQRRYGKRSSRLWSAEYLESAEKLRIFHRRYIVGILTNKLHHLTERDSRLIHFSAHEILKNFAPISHRYKCCHYHAACDNHYSDNIKVAGLSNIHVKRVFQQTDHDAVEYLHFLNFKNFRPALNWQLASLPCAYAETDGKIVKLLLDC